MASVAAPSASLAGKRPASGGREGDQMVITPLGAGSEVGRSCVHLTFKGRTVLVSTPFPLPLANPTCFRFPLLLLIGTIVLRWRLVRLRHPPGLLRHGGAALLRRDRSVHRRRPPHHPVISLSLLTLTRSHLAFLQVCMPDL
jgi:hypothetical protein